MNRILKKMLVVLGLVAPYIVMCKLYFDKKKLEKEYGNAVVEAYFTGREDEERVRREYITRVTEVTEES